MNTSLGTTLERLSTISNQCKTAFEEKGVSGITKFKQYPAAIQSIKAGGKIQLEAPSHVEVLGNSNHVKIKWTDPDNLVIDGNTLATWAGTKVIRKTGSPPRDINDGTQVLNVTSKNAYAYSFYQDYQAPEGVTYYYGIFPYTTDDIYNTEVIIKPKYNDDLTNAPGPKKLVAGDMEAGYFGKVSANDLFTTSELMMEIGATSISYKDEYAGWYKFAWQNKIIFITASFRGELNKNILDSETKDIRTCTSTLITKNGVTYGLGLMQGANPNFVEATVKNKRPDNSSLGSFKQWSRGSMYNNTMLAIGTTDFRGSDEVSNSDKYFINIKEDWYTVVKNKMENLKIASGLNNIRCRERIQTENDYFSTFYYIVRGNNYSSEGFSSNAVSHFLWWPMLEVKE